MIGNRQVQWFAVYEFVASLLAGITSWPAAGTAAWCALADDDPRKLAAVLDGGVHHALRLDTLQQEQSQISSAISEAGTEEGDWAALARITARGNGARIPRRRAS